MNEILKLHLFVGTTLFLVSFLMKVWPPKKINHWYGYRTPVSTKNQTNWNIANTYAADLMMWAGISNAFVQIISYLFIGGELSIYISLGYYLTFIFISIILVEKRLKTTGT